MSSRIVGEYKIPGGHRRSKTDGNGIQMTAQQYKQIVEQQQNSRQQNININIHGQNSNQSAKSAQIKKNVTSISMEQAAKNFRISSNPGDVQDAPTRNSNLINLPKDDRLKKDAQGYGYSNSYSHNSKQ